MKVVEPTAASGFVDPATPHVILPAMLMHAPVPLAALIGVCLLCVLVPGLAFACIDDVFRVLASLCLLIACRTDCPDVVDVLPLIPAWPSVKTA
jgi:hypothetical protein